MTNSIITSRIFVVKLFRGAITDFCFKTGIVLKTKLSQKHLQKYSASGDTKAPNYHKDKKQSIQKWNVFICASKLSVPS